jgi:hypothetical protein
MGTVSIVAEIDEEIARLNQARAILVESQETVSTASVTPKKHYNKRVLSEEARARIGAAQHKRWAAKAAAEKAKSKDKVQRKAKTPGKAKAQAKAKASAKAKVALKTKAAPKPKAEPSPKPESEEAK